MKRFWNKYTRTAIIVFVGIGLALIGFIINENKISNSIQTKQVIIVKEDITPFKAITKESLQYQEVVISAVPNDAIENADDLNFDDLYAGEVGFSKGAILRKGYITNAQDSKVGTALGLSKGKVEVGVQTTLAQSAGDGAKPGVYVDVVAVITDERTGESKKITKKENPNLSNLLVIRRLNAEGTTPDIESGKSLIPTVVVLEATTEQAADLVQYQEAGKVYLTPSGTNLNTK